MNQISFFHCGLFVLILLGLSACGKEEHPALAYEVKGIDVSRYQDKINWNQVERTGLDFAFVKATEGGDHRDAFFKDNWRALGQSGIRRGAYHFFRPGVAPKTQANNFFDQLGEISVGDLPPVLDVETRGKLGNAEFITSIKEWLLLVEVKYGVKPIIYSGQKFYNRFLAGHFPDYPVWIARYSQEVPTLADGRKFQFWQYSDQGKLPGIDGPVDINIFTGSPIDLALLTVPHRTSADVEAPLAIQ